MPVSARSDGRRRFAARDDHRSAGSAVGWLAELLLEPCDLRVEDRRRDGCRRPCASRDAPEPVELVVRARAPDRRSAELDRRSEIVRRARSPASWNTANIRNTENRNSAIGETNRARSPSMYRRVSSPGRQASSGSVRQILPSKCSTPWSRSWKNALIVRWTCACWPQLVAMRADRARAAVEASRPRRMSALVVGPHPPPARPRARTTPPSNTAIAESISITERSSRGLMPWPGELARRSRATARRNPAPRASAARTRRPACGAPPHCSTALASGMTGQSGLASTRVAVELAAQVDHRQHRQDRRCALVALAADFGDHHVERAGRQRRGRQRHDHHVGRAHHLRADLVEHRRAVEHDPLVTPPTGPRSAWPAAASCRARTAGSSSARRLSSAGSRSSPRYSVSRIRLAASRSFENTPSRCACLAADRRRPGTPPRPRHRDPTAASCGGEHRPSTTRRLAAMVVLPTPPLTE